MRNNKTQNMPTFTADFSKMGEMPSWYVGGSRFRYPRTNESQAVTQPMSVVR